MTTSQLEQIIIHQIRLPCCLAITCNSGGNTYSQFHVVLGHGIKTADRTLEQLRRIFLPFFLRVLTFFTFGGGDAVLIKCCATKGVDIPNGWEK
jgi:hypothetical protein